MIALIVVVVLLGGLGLTGYHFYSEYKSAHATYTGNGFGTVDVHRATGCHRGIDVAAAIVQKLGVIAAVDPFVSYVDTSKNPTGSAAGRVPAAQAHGQPAGLGDAHQRKNAVNSTVTIPDGLRYTKILPLLAKESHLPLSDFQAAIRGDVEAGPAVLGQGQPRGLPLPGYLRHRARARPPRWGSCRPRCTSSTSR